MQRSHMDACQQAAACTGETNAYENGGSSTCVPPSLSGRPKPASAPPSNGSPPLAVAISVSLPSFTNPDVSASGHVPFCALAT